MVSFHYIHILVGTLHVVLFPHYSLQRGRICVQAHVECAIVAHSVVILLYFSFQSLYFVLKLRTSRIGVFVEKQHKKYIAHGHYQRKSDVTPAPAEYIGNGFIHFQINSMQR